MDGRTGCLAQGWMDRRCVKPRYRWKEGVRFVYPRLGFKYVQPRWGGKRKGKSLGADGKKVFVAQVNRIKVYVTSCGWKECVCIPGVDGKKLYVTWMWTEKRYV